MSGVAIHGQGMYFIPFWMQVVLIVMAGVAVAILFKL